MTGEAIIFSGTDLLNGQHRLYACIQAEVPFTTLVVRNVTEDSFTFMDSGLVRTHGDVLAANGVVDGNLLASVVRLVVSFEGGYISDKSEKANKITKAVTLAEATNFRGDLYYRACHQGRRTIKLGGNASAFSAFYFLASQVTDEENVAEWMDGFVTGANLAVGDPRLALRNWLSNQKRHQNTVHLAAIIRAWNAYTAGQKLTLVRPWIPGQPFPEVSTL